MTPELLRADLNPSTSKHAFQSVFTGSCARFSAKPWQFAIYFNCGQGRLRNGLSITGTSDTGLKNDE